VPIRLRRFSGRRRSGEPGCSRCLYPRECPEMVVAVCIFMWSTTRTVSSWGVLPGRCLLHDRVSAGMMPVHWRMSAVRSFLAAGGDAKGRDGRRSDHEQWRVSSTTRSGIWRSCAPNVPAHEVHGFASGDDTPPTELLAAGSAAEPTAVTAHPGPHNARQAMRLLLALPHRGPAGCVTERRTPWYEG